MSHTRFYVLAVGDRFTFPNDAANAVCVKTGPATYRVDTASDRSSVGLKCASRPDAIVERAPDLLPVGEVIGTVCSCDYCHGLSMAMPRSHSK